VVLTEIQADSTNLVMPGRIFQLNSLNLVKFCIDLARQNCRNSRSGVDLRHFLPLVNLKLAPPKFMKTFKWLYILLSARLTTKSFGEYKQ